MTTRLIARVMSAVRDEELDVLEAGFAGNGDGSGFAFIVMRSADEPDADDVRMGWDSYCLTTADGLTHYGGLESMTLDDRRLVLRLTSEAADTLELDRDVEVELQVDADELHEFRDLLPGIVLWGRTDARPSLFGF